jgi:hypothetical protein
MLTIACRRTFDPSVGDFIAETRYNKRQITQA